MIAKANGFRKDCVITNVSPRTISNRTERNMMVARLVFIAGCSSCNTNVPGQDNKAEVHHRDTEAQRIYVSGHISCARMCVSRLMIERPSLWQIQTLSHCIWTPSFPRD